MENERRFNILRSIIMTSFLNSKEKMEMLNFVTVLEESKSKEEPTND